MVGQLTKHCMLDLNIVQYRAGVDCYTDLMQIALQTSFIRYVCDICTYSYIQ